MSRADELSLPPRGWRTPRTAPVPALDPSFAPCEGAHRTTLRNGLSLEYAVQGATDGVPVVLLHGVTDSWRSFEPMLAQLPEGIRAYAPTLRGHGGSDKPSGAYRYADMAGDVAQFMEALGIERAIVAGHSMGSMVAQQLAADAPERVEALVLLGAFDTLHDDAAMAEFTHSVVLPLRDPIGAEFARDWQTSTLARPIDPAFLECVVDETLKVPARVWHAAFTGFIETPTALPRLAAQPVPTLIVWGDQDAYASRLRQDRLLAALPGARLHVHPGAGHALHWEDPVAVAGELVRFVAARETRGG